MIRAIYRVLLWLHAPAFRRQFAAEMLWIFDESAESQVALCFDGAVSLVRQWLLRTGWWKIAIAIALASFQITLGGFGTLLFGPRSIEHVTSEQMVPSLWSIPSGSSLAHQQITIPIVIYLSLFVIGGLSVLILGLSFWLKAVSSRRRPVPLRVR